MGLFDKLVTDNSRFRTLKYSEFDTELLVETPLPGVTEELNYLDLPGGNGPTVDFFRGGLGNIASRKDDVTRITKFFGTPQGILFTAKQEALSNLGVRTQAGGILNEGLYLPTSTIAQVGVMGTGIFLNKQGIEVTGLGVNENGSGGARPTYFSLTNKEFIQSVESNRLILLTNKRLGFSFVNPKGTTVSENPNNLLTYRGGPNNAGGIGVTNIPYLNDQRTSLLNPYFDNNNLLVYQLNSSPEAPLTNPNSPLVQSTKRKTQYFRSSLQDFRRGLYSSLDKDENGNTFSANISSAPNYSDKGIETRVNLGNPGDPSYNRFNYGTGITYNTDINALDTINAFPLYSALNVDFNDTSPGGILNDLVKFRIAAINNDDPSLKVFMHFRAFLNSMTDNYNPEWGSEKYVGRGDTLYKYGGFTRAVNLSWTVVAQSSQEMMPMYRKLNYLASNTMPDYSEAGYMRGPLIELTVGGYLYDQPGFITSLNYTLRTDTGWEIAIGPGGDELEDELGDNIENYELPHAIDVQMGFTPIHEFLPGKVKGALIAPGEGFYTNSARANNAPSIPAGFGNTQKTNQYLVNQYKNYIALTDKGNTFNNY
jgi:hypothetical protein